MDDGTTTSTASGTDTFKFRVANDRISIVITNDDVTHGDNALFTFHEDRVVHQNLSGAGTNTHAQIDAFIAAGGPALWSKAGTILSPTTANDTVKIPNTVDSFADYVFSVEQNPTTTEGSFPTIYVRGETSGYAVQILQYGTGGILQLQDGTTSRFLFTQVGDLIMNDSAKLYMDGGTDDYITNETGVWYMYINDIRELRVTAILRSTQKHWSKACRRERIFH
jgi:hypothetical protein